VPSLRDFQLGFHRALRGDTSAISSIDPPIRHLGLAPERRLQVYRNNMEASLTGSLRATYPAVCALVGEDFFRMLAKRYIPQHPSRSGDLHRFGDRFAEFVSGVEEARQLPYLSDVCALEWAYHLVFHAADEGALDATALADIPPADVPDIRLKLHPASILLTSAFPVTRIWQLAIHEQSDARPVDISCGPEYLIVARRDLEIEFQSMHAAEFAFMQALAKGETLAECAEDAIRIEPDFDLLACLARQFMRGNITGFHDIGT
jgi:hypothetical protein